MSRGGGDGGVPDGEVHVQRVDKIVVVMNGVAPLPTAVEKKVGGGLMNVDEIAADFIRRKKEAFQRGNNNKPAGQVD
uniref:Uncharacterized protein n=1 Tax=Oryza meridionalis TaxID=40149 RepID=A0A0E0DLS9_9ORYZ